MQMFEHYYAKMNNKLKQNDHKWSLMVQEFNEILRVNTEIMIPDDFTLVTILKTCKPKENVLM